MDLESNLAMIENVEFEEKVDIDDLVLPPNPIANSEIEVSEIKREPIVEQNQHAAYESDLDVKKAFQLKMEENILKLYKELDIEKSGSSRMDFRMVTEIVLLKTKIVEITNEHKIAMSLNEKTMNSIVKMHEKAFEDKKNELANIKEELQSVKDANQELLQEIQALKMNKTNFDSHDSFEGNLEIKPFSSEYCDKSFNQFHELKEHIKIHDSVSKVEDENTILSYDKDCVTDDQVTQVRKELDQPIDKKTLSNLEETAPIDIIEQGEGVLDIEEGIPQKASDYVPYQCHTCKKTGHFSWNCPDMECYKCFGTGHMSYECKNKIVCYSCQEIGHKARDCKNAAG